MCSIRQVLVLLCAAAVCGAAAAGPRRRSTFFTPPSVLFADTPAPIGGAPALIGGAPAPVYTGPDEEVYNSASYDPPPAPQDSYPAPGGVSVSYGAPSGVPSCPPGHLLNTDGRYGRRGRGGRAWGGNIGSGALHGLYSFIQLYLGSHQQRLIFFSGLSYRTENQLTTTHLNEVKVTIN